MNRNIRAAVSHTATLLPVIPHQFAGTRGLDYKVIDLSLSWIHCPIESIVSPRFATVATFSGIPGLLKYPWRFAHGPARTRDALTGIEVPMVHFFIPQGKLRNAGRSTP